MATILCGRFRAPRGLALAAALAICLALVPRPALAAELRVPDQFPTIQAALDAAASGDTVLVAPGSYAENLNFQGKDVELRSTGGAAVTTLAVPGGTGVLIGPAGAFIGFTVTGALRRLRRRDGGVRGRNPHSGQRLRRQRPDGGGLRGCHRRQLRFAGHRPQRLPEQLL